MQPKKSKTNKNVESQQSAGKRIQKPPGLVLVLGLANKKTWVAINSKTLGIKKPSWPVPDNKGKGKNTRLFSLMSMYSAFGCLA